MDLRELDLQGNWDFETALFNYALCYDENSDMDSIECLRAGLDILIERHNKVQHVKDVHAK